MARIVIARAVGGADQLDVVDEELPALEPGRVRVAVRAAALNPADVKRLAGNFGPVDPPFRLGSEAAGVVTEVAPGTEGPAGPISVGDEVIVYPASGAYASELIAPATSILPKPEGMSFEEAAGLLAAGVTAVHMVSATGVGPGDRVLVHGASGAVGVIALQLIREDGATAVGTGSAASAATVESFGARAVAYGPGLADRVLALWPEGPTAALDCVGTDEALDVSAALIPDRSRIATIAGFARGAELGVKLLGGGPGAERGSELRTAARLDLLALARGGRLHMPVGEVFPLDRVRDAVELIATGHPGGKVILVP